MGANKDIVDRKTMISEIVALEQHYENLLGPGGQRKLHEIDLEIMRWQGIRQRVVDQIAEAPEMLIRLRRKRETLESVAIVKASKPMFKVDKKLERLARLREQARQLEAELGQQGVTV